MEGSCEQVPLPHCYDHFTFCIFFLRYSNHNVKGWEENKRKTSKLLYASETIVLLNRLTTDIHRVWNFRLIQTDYNNLGIQNRGTISVEMIWDLWEQQKIPTNLFAFTRGTWVQVGVWRDRAVSQHLDFGSHIKNCRSSDEDSTKCFWTTFGRH